MYLSLGTTGGHQVFTLESVSAFAYWSVASIWRFMPFQSRFQIIPEIMRISAGSLVSFSSIEAIVSASSSGTRAAVEVL